MYRSDDGEPGFSSLSFTLLELKRRKSSKNFECCLIYDEMDIQQLQSCKHDIFFDYVDMGLGQVNEGKIATKAFVMMLVCLDDDWKLPIGYFLIDSFSSALLANIIIICLEKCDYIGINVRAISFTGSDRNIKAANLLGCNISSEGELITTFLHPVTEQHVAVFMDACHMIKLVREVFEKRKILINKKGQRIEWKFLMQLLKLQKNQRFDFGGKEKNKRIYFRNQIMKIKLGTQFLSRNVAKALTLCNEVLKSKHFSESNATVEFINFLNNSLDILNSRRLNQSGYKRAIRPKNKKLIFNFIDQFIAYIKGLKICIKFQRFIKHFYRQPRFVMVKIIKPVLASSFKTGFLGLIVSLESLKILYEKLVEYDCNLGYISTYRLSQYHLELFFNLIRKYAGSNRDPDAEMFKWAYNHSLNHLSTDALFNENGIAFDHCGFFWESSVEIINSTSDMNRYEVEDEFMDQASQDTYQEEEDEVYSRNCAQLSLTLNNKTKIRVLSVNIELIVGYIAGWVARKLIKKIKCEICISSLVSDEKLFFHKLIEVKNMDGLCFPSPDVFQVCLETEKTIRNNDGPQFMTETDYMYLSTLTLSSFVGKNTFSVLSFHSAEQPATLNHRLHLIRAIIKKYINIRFNYESNIDNMKKGKLVLFKHNK